MTTLVLPGDSIPLEQSTSSTSSTPALRLGPGTSPFSDKAAAATRAGLLGFQAPSRTGNASKAMESYWVDGTTRRVNLASEFSPMLPFF